jgi:nitronate monooxygenase
MAAQRHSSASKPHGNAQVNLIRARSPFNDQIKDDKLWGPLYDGRSIVGPVHEKFMGGASLEECQKSLKEDYSAEEATKIISTWA